MSKMLVKLENINYKELYKKIFHEEVDSKDRLELFTLYVQSMHYKNGSNPLHYTLEYMEEYADVYSKMDEFERLFVPKRKTRR